MAWTWEHADNLIDAFIEYGNDNVTNVDASVIIAVINHGGEWVWHADIEHLKPAPGHTNPSLKRFLHIPSAAEYTGPTTQVARTDSIMGLYPPGSYNGYWTFCTQVDKRIIKFFMESWRKNVDPILDIDGIERSALADINFVSQNIIDAMSRNGGNTLGLAGKGPLLVFLMEPFWTKTKDGPRVWAAMEATATTTQAEAKRLGLHHQYVYLNYANLHQDVYTGYGTEANDFLNHVCYRYDPDGVFQNLRRAGWHLRASSASKPTTNEVAKTSNL